MNGFDEKLIDTLSRLQKGEKESFSSLDSSFFPLTASLAAKYGKGDEYDDSLQSAIIFCSRMSALACMPRFVSAMP